MVAKKCKMYSLDEGVWEDCNARGLIPEDSSHIEEGIYAHENGDRLKSITFFNVPIGEPEYLEVVLRDKAPEATRVIRVYVEDLEDENPQELWTVLRYSLHHMINYWLRRKKEIPYKEGKMKDIGAPVGYTVL